MGEALLVCIRFIMQSYPEEANYVHDISHRSLQEKLVENMINLKLYMSASVFPTGL